MFLLKLLLGATGIGAGVVAPVVANKIMNSVPNQVAELTGLDKTEAWKKVQEKIAENETNARIRGALKDLNSKECKLIKNPREVDNGFDRLYACKGEANKTDFYYLGTQESFKSDSGSYLPRKVSKVNYKEGLDGRVAQLVLTLEDKSEINWNVVSGSGWGYFKDVVLSDSCEIKTKELGGDDLGCTLKNSDGSYFYYRFSVF